MPVTIFTTISELNAYVASQIAANGSNAITGPIAQEVLQSINLSLLEIMNSLPGQTVNVFDPWDGGTTYTGGQEVVVQHNNKLWLFVSGSNSLGTEPGTNGLVWQQINAVQLAHFRNQDQFLDQSGPNQVSAFQLRRLLSLRQSWGYPVDDVATEPVGGEPIGYAYAVQSPAAGDFTGHEGGRAEMTITGWSFQVGEQGDTHYVRNLHAIASSDGAWFTVLSLSLPSLAEVLAAGASTGVESIEIDTPTTDGYAQMNHNSAGTVALPLDSAPAVVVNIAADAQISKVSVMGRLGLRHITLVGGTGTHALTWALAWYKLSSVTLPTTIAGGQTYMLTVRSHAFIGDVILSCDEVVSV